MHPGWLMPCLNVADLAASLAFYEGLGLRRTSGNPAQGWAILGNGPIEWGLYSGHFDGWMLNFRGDNVPDLARRFAALGLNIVEQTRYDPAAGQAEWSRTGDSLPLLTTECGDCTLLDPDGRVLYFDTVPTERARFRRGEPYAADDYDGSLQAGQPNLGSLIVELATLAPAALLNFYEQLGLQRAGASLDNGQSWRIRVSAGEPGAAFTFHSGGTPRELMDPDGYSINLR